MRTCAESNEPSRANILPPPSGEGWGGGCNMRRACGIPPFLSLSRARGREENAALFGFLLRLDRLDAHQVPDFVDLLDERLCAQDVGTVLVEFGVDDGFHAARPRRHHDHPLGEVDRLLHVMRYENDG